MRLYVSGPMTGHPDWNFPAFNSAATLLREAGYDVVNPADIGEGDPEKTWEEYLREDLRLLLECDAVATLAGWRDSRGARLECHVAEQLAMPIDTVEMWAACAEHMLVEVPC